MPRRSARPIQPPFRRVESAPAGPPRLWPAWRSGFPSAPRPKRANCESFLSLASTLLGSTAPQRGHSREPNRSPPFPFRPFRRFAARDPIAPDCPQTVQTTGTSSLAFPPFTGASFATSYTSTPSDAKRSQCQTAIARRYLGPYGNLPARQKAPCWRAVGAMRRSWCRGCRTLNLTSIMRPTTLFFATWTPQALVRQRVDLSAPAADLPADRRCPRGAVATAARCSDGSQPASQRGGTGAIGQWPWQDSNLRPSV